MNVQLERTKTLEYNKKNSICSNPFNQQLYILLTQQWHCSLKLNNISDRYPITIVIISKVFVCITYIITTVYSSIIFFFTIVKVNTFTQIYWIYLLNNN